MAHNSFLSESLAHLRVIAERTYPVEILPVSTALWKRHLQPENPLWKYVTARPFSINTTKYSAHVMALVDSRLPKLGLLGYFASSNRASGKEVVLQAVEWLRDKHNLHQIYGPINGTITSDYRFNLSEDWKFPSEPVNPSFHIQAFEDAGFGIYNRYVSGIATHYKVFAMLFRSKPPKEFQDVILRPFSVTDQFRDLRIYHDLMNRIFPANSIYCPVISYEEREYNLAVKDPIFDPSYTYFLEYNGNVIGFVVAFPFQDNLVLKTIGLLPEYRKKGLSQLLILKVHDQAAKDHLKKAIYATIRVGNEAYKMKRPGVRIFRRYITMQKLV